MNRKAPIAALLIGLVVPGFAFAQDAVPKPEPTDHPMTQAEEAVSDSWITTKVKADLLATDNVAGTSINVDTRDGVVTLTGNVKSQAEADKAEAVAKNIKGVMQVDSQLKVDVVAP